MKLNTGDNIKYFRKKMGMDQKQLAEKMNVTAGTISNWEQGKFEPDIKALIALSDIFNIGMEDLVKLNTSYFEMDLNPHGAMTGNQRRARDIERVIDSKKHTMFLEDLKSVLISNDLNGDHQSKEEKEDSILTLLWTNLDIVTRGRLGRKDMENLAFMVSILGRAIKYSDPSTHKSTIDLISNILEERRGENKN